MKSEPKLSAESAIGQRKKRQMRVKNIQNRHSGASIFDAEILSTTREDLLFKSLLKAEFNKDGNRMTATVAPASKPWRMASASSLRKTGATISVTHQLRSARGSRSVVILVSALTIGLAGMTEGVCTGAACRLTVASPVGLVRESLFGVVVLPVCATAKPIEPTIPSAVAEVIKNFDMFMVKLR